MMARMQWALNSFCKKKDDAPMTHSLQFWDFKFLTCSGKVIYPSKSKLIFLLYIQINTIIL
jgi:hypothetical protein